jgi:Transposase DDE domain
MITNNKVIRCKQQRLEKYVGKSDSYDFFNLLTSPELLASVEGQLPEHRERLFPPTETLAMFMAQSLNQDGSCQKAVNDAAVKRVLGGLAPNSTATGAYCRARSKLPLSMISTLVKRTGQLIDNEVPSQWRWQGRIVRLIDGTTVSMPDTSDNQESYPQQGSQKPGLGFPICRIVGVICLATGAILNAAIGKFNGKGASEHNLLRTLLDTFKPNDVVLGDAFYGSYSLLVSMLDKEVDVVFEQMGPRKKKTDFRKGESIGPKDHLIDIPKPKLRPNWMSQEAFDLLPNSVHIRELKVGGKILITTLLSPKETTKQALKELYQKRWHIELDFRNIKTTLGMEKFSCKTSQMNEKEMWVYFLAYNLIRLLMAQAALLADLQPRQLSFKHTLQLWIAWSTQAFSGESGADEGQLFFLIAQRTVDNRPGRIEPRAVKRRPKPMPLLVKTREQARADVRKHGHPKKLK